MDWVSISGAITDSEDELRHVILLFPMRFVTGTKVLNEIEKSSDIFEEVDRGEIRGRVLAANIVY